MMELFRLRLLCPRLKQRLQRSTLARGRTRFQDLQSSTLHLEVQDSQMRLNVVCLFLFRYSAIPDFADCSEADRREAQDILDAVMRDSLLSDTALVENSTNNNNEEEEDVTAAVERAIIDPSGSC